MFSRLRSFFLRLLYKALIYKTIVLDKTSLYNYDKLITFCALDIETDKGKFTFLFKQDRRKNSRNRYNFLSVANFIIELVIPENLLPVEDTVKEKIVIVVKIMLFKVDYEIFTRVLTDTYLDSIINHVKSRKK